jgi:hypothetical protein
LGIIFFVLLGLVIAVKAVLFRKVNVTTCSTLCTAWAPRTLFSTAWGIAQRVLPSKCMDKDALLMKIDLGSIPVVLPRMTLRDGTKVANIAVVLPPDCLSMRQASSCSVHHHMAESGMFGRVHRVGASVVISQNLDGQTHNLVIRRCAVRTCFQGTPLAHVPGSMSAIGDRLHAGSLRLRCIDAECTSAGVHVQVVAALFRHTELLCLSFW